MNDLKRLATLGDLPISLETSTLLRVRFPGCDADTVERLCLELNIKRGIVGQDDSFDEKAGVEMALMFPFASSRSPSEISYERRPTKRLKSSRRDNVVWQDMFSLRDRSQTMSPLPPSPELADIVEIHDNPWLSSPSGYSSLHPSEYEGNAGMLFDPHFKSAPNKSSIHPSTATGASQPPHHDYEGIEGIYRFIEECDRAKH